MTKINADRMHYNVQMVNCWGHCFR